MKACHKLFLLLALLLAGKNVLPQTNSAKSLVDEGIALFDKGNYPEAVEKYKDALKITPDDFRADYEMGYTLYVMGKGKDAIPFLESILKSNESKYETYELLGSIYDDSGDSEKAVEYYKDGIKEKPDYERLHFNLSITYLRLKKYPEAETEAIEAIKLDPKHASAQRALALAANYQGKLGRSLLGWCSFLLIEPQSKRSPEAFAYVKAIINHGLKKTEKGADITYDVKTGTANLMMPLAVISATEGKKDLTKLDSLQLQLTSLFQIAHTIADDSSQTFIAHYYGDFFEALAKSGNMPAFTRFISLSAYKDENLAWFKEHDKELSTFDAWIASTERKF